MDSDISSKLDPNTACDLDSIFKKKSFPSQQGNRASNTQGVRSVN